MTNSFSRRHFLNTAIATGFGSLLLEGLLGCKETSTTVVNRDAAFKIIMDGADPMLYTYQQTPDSDLIEFYGRRDANGLPSMIDQMLVVNKDDRSKISYFTFNDSRKLQSVLTNNGVFYEFQGYEGENIAVTVTVPDGSFQFNTSYTPNGKRVGALKEKATYQSRAGIPLKLTEMVQAAKLDRENLRTSAGKMEVNVTKCGFPSSGNISIDIYTNELNKVYLTNVPAYPTGSPGIYTADIPDLTVPKSVVGNMLAAVADSMGVVCSVVGDLSLDPKSATPFCLWLSGTLAVYVPPTAPFFPLILTGCEVLTSAMILICESKIYKALEKIGEGRISEYESVMDFVTNKLNESVKEVIMYPRCLGWPSPILGTPKIFPLANTSGKLVLEMFNNVHIRKMILDPAIPAEDTDYTIIAEIDCLAVGTTVMIKVVGSDEYEQSESVTIGTAEASKRLSVTVPGAESGVLDKVTLTVWQADGKTDKREATLVFT